MKRLILAAVAVSLVNTLLLAAEPQVVFEDKFEGKLGEGWNWLRENPKTWRIRDGALEIRLEPGDAGTVKNALLRSAPDRGKGTCVFDVTVTSLTPPSVQYEQAGMTWYRDGKPLFKFVKERIDGKTYVFPGKVPVDCKTVQLRLIVDAAGWTAQFRPNAKGEFQTAAKGKQPAGGIEQISLQGYHGPPTAAHWIRFDDFRVLKLDK
ncbi:MAG: hypothetical protein JW959_02080 [Pirellulales bacterium]|nr:hypothetical protein [Pirellulales bacterium]